MQTGCWNAQELQHTNFSFRNSMRKWGNICTPIFILSTFTLRALKLFLKTQKIPAPPISPCRSSHWICAVTPNQAHCAPCAPEHFADSFQPPDLSTFPTGHFHPDYEKIKSLRLSLLIHSPNIHAGTLLSFTALNKWSQEKEPVISTYENIKASDEQLQLLLWRVGYLLSKQYNANNSNHILELLK